MLFYDKFRTISFEYAHFFSHLKMSSYHADKHTQNHIVLRNMQRNHPILQLLRTIIQFIDSIKFQVPSCAVFGGILMNPINNSIISVDLALNCAKWKRLATENHVVVAAFSLSFHIKL